MKSLKIEYTPTAASSLRRLHPIVKKPLKEIIEELAVNPYSGKALKSEFEGYRSHRFRRYRVIYRYHEEKNQIEVLLAGPRVDIYSRFAELLRKTKKPAA